VEQIDAEVFQEVEDDEPKRYVGVDFDGKMRHDVYGGRFAAAPTTLEAFGVMPGGDEFELRAKGLIPQADAGQVQASPFT
jgi:hypothetical protein